MNKHLIHEMAKIEENYWWFKQKRHFLQQLIKENSKLSKLDILDCGCGTGTTLKTLRNFGEVYGIDFDRDCINYCKNRGLDNVIHQDITKPIKFKKKFDVVIISDVLEHLENPEKALHEINKVTKKDGIVLITVPAHPWLYGKWDKMLHHKRRYTLNTLENLIRTQPDFNIIKKGYYNLQSLPPAIISKYIIMKLFKLKSQFWNTTPMLNKILSSTGKLDNSLALRLPFYLGLSIYAVVKKK